VVVEADRLVAQAATAGTVVQDAAAAAAVLVLRLASGVMAGQGLFI
jgi:hypothetical protein